MFALSESDEASSAKPAICRPEISNDSLHFPDWQIADQH